MSCARIFRSSPCARTRAPASPAGLRVRAGYAASIEESEIKLEHDLYYIQHMSSRLDLVILLMTAKVVLFGNEFIARAPGRREANQKRRMQPSQDAASRPNPRKRAHEAVEETGVMPGLVRRDVPTTESPAVPAFAEVDGTSSARA